MRFELAPFAPVVRVVVMRHVAKEQAGLSAMDYHPDVERNADRPEVVVFGLFELVKLETRVGRVELEIEGGGLDSFLLVGSETGEAFGEGIGYSEVHEELVFITILVDDGHAKLKA